MARRSAARRRARTSRIRARRKQKRLKLKYSRHGYRKARRHGRSVRGKWSTVKKYRRKAHNPGHFRAEDFMDTEKGEYHFTGPWVITASAHDTAGKPYRASGSGRLTDRALLQHANKIARMAGRRGAARFFEIATVSARNGVEHIALEFGS